ncbi:MAG: phosphoribosyltransferase family protein [Actinomycetota bacterium]
MLFIDRTDAGRQLAPLLDHLRGQDVVVLGLPRGGVPVAFELATALGAPLDVILVRKVGVPFQPELAMGALGEGGVRVLNEDVIAASGVSAAELAGVEARERAELARRGARFRGRRAPVPLAGRVALIVDDGLATGATARAACLVARAAGAARVVLAVPVAPRDSLAAARRAADDVVCVSTPEPFYGIGQWYHDFTQVTDDEVVDLLRRAAPATDDPPLPRGFAVLDGERNEDVAVATGTVTLPGYLVVPERAAAVVVFAHGSGSSRHSARNRSVASVLNRAGIGTLLFDLLRAEEEANRANVFDVVLLAKRLRGAVDWLRNAAGFATTPIGLFGASTGAAAALWTAAEPTAEVCAVVSRGGRPDLAGARLSLVRSPTLLIVGGEDHVVLDLNRKAQAQMRCESQLSIVGGATHLFAEPGTLEVAARLATDWFVHHLAPAAPDARRR